MKQIKFNHSFLTAIKSGEKTQTRRILKGHDSTDTYPIMDDGYIKDYNYSNCWHGIKYYIEGYAKYKVNEKVQISWVIDGEPKKSPYIIKITNIKVESIHDISNEDVAKEGFESKEEFIDTMIDIYGRRSKYCFVYEFELVEEQENE